MSELILKINQDQQYEFFQSYDRLGEMQKKIWACTVWWCKKFPLAFPRQQKIAEEVGCTRKHVNRTFKLFQELGWLILISRGARRSKILMASEPHMMIDLVNRKYFRKMEVSDGVTHSYPTKKKETSYKAGYLATQPKKQIEIPRIAVELNFSKENSLKLGLVSESVIEETKYQLRKMLAKAWRPEKQHEYIVGMALTIAKKKGERMDWVSYYRELRA